MKVYFGWIITTVYMNMWRLKHVRFVSFTMVPRQQPPSSRRLRPHGGGVASPQTYVSGDYGSSNSSSSSNSGSGVGRLNPIMRHKQLSNNVKQRWKRWIVQLPHPHSTYSWSTTLPTTNVELCLALVGRRQNPNQYQVAIFRVSPIMLLEISNGIFPPPCHPSHKLGRPLSTI